MSKKKVNSTYALIGPLIKQNISELEVFTQVVIATRAFWARNNPYGF